MQTASQFLLLDVDVPWEATTPDPGHNFYFEPLGERVWGSDYASAQLYQRLEIIGKPSDQLLEGWLCLWNPRWDREVCTYAADGDQSRWPVFRITRDGTYYTRWPAVSTWPGAHGRHEQRFDCTAPVTHVRFQLFGVFRDPAGQFRDQIGRYNIMKLRDGHWTSDAALRDHIPFRLRTQVYVVKPGRALVAPAGWQDMPADWHVMQR